jgi:integrase
MKRAAADAREVSPNPAGHRPREYATCVTQPPKREETIVNGIRKLHSKGCPGRDGGRCRCGAGWEASVFSKRDGKKIRKTFPNRAEAKTWRDDANTQLAKGGLRAPKPTTLREAWEAWHQGAKAGTIRNRSGDRYKPSAVRGYDQGMRLRVLPEFGDARLADLDRVELQRFVYRLLESGLAPSTIEVSLLPVRAIYRQALERGEISVNPCDKLRLPRSDTRRDRIASPAEGAALIAAVSQEDRPLWATAMYAGLRRGEIQALRACDVDLAAGLLRLEHGWDYKEGVIELKSNAGLRRVPIPAILRDHLVEQRLRVEREGEQLFFGRTAADPFSPDQIQRRADKAWKAAGLERITYHGCRHTYASLMIAAGVNAKALSVFMGHANIGITMDRYGHLMPGSEEEAAGMLDVYLEAKREAAEDRARDAAPASG